MIYYKKVLMPIEVVEGDYCFGYGRVCGHFDNEGGYATCGLGFDLARCHQGTEVLKPAKCKDLKEVEL